MASLNLGSNKNKLNKGNAIKATGLIALKSSMTGELMFSTLFIDRNIL